MLFRSDKQATATPDAPVLQLLQETGLVKVPVNVVNRPAGGGTLAWGGLNQYPGDGHYIAISTARIRKMLAVMSRRASRS